MCPRNSDDSTRPMVSRDKTQFGTGGDDDHVAPPMVYKSRHISLHSRVDSLGGGGEEFTEISLTNNKRSGPSSDWLELGASNPFYEEEKQDEEEEEEDVSDNEYSIYSRSLSPGPAPGPASQTPLEVSKYHEVLFVGVVIMAQFMGSAGLGQAIAPRNSIARDLGVTNLAAQAWFTAAYMSTFGTFTLVSGRMGDILGHKRVLAFGYLFLGSWSAFAGFSAYAGGQVFFNVCRAFQGVGAALLAPNALALLARAYPPGIRRNTVLSLFVAMVPWGFVVGALFASMFAEVAWWPWAFWSYGIVAWLLAALSSVVIPKSLAFEAQFATRTERPGWDFVGTSLGVLGLILISVAWNNGPLFGWGAPHVYFLLIIGLLSLAAFVWVEARAVSPILPVKSMNSTVICTLVLIGGAWGSFGIWIYYSFRFLEETRSFSSLSVSIQYIPAAVCGLLAIGVTRLLLTHIPLAFAMFVSMVAFFVGELTTATQPAKQTYWAQNFVAIVIIPFGMNLSFPAGTLLISNSMPPEYPGLAASLVSTMISHSVSIALGIAGTVEVQVNDHGAAKEDTLWGIRCAWWTGVALAGCGVVLGAALFGRTLLKEGWKVVEH